VHNRRCSLPQQAPSQTGWVCMLVVMHQAGRCGLRQRNLLILPCHTVMSLLYMRLPCAYLPYARRYPLTAANAA
jgi:hypothetical protein